MSIEMGMPGYCSVSELLACFLARDLNDGEELQVGVALPIPEAAVRLAHLMHGPNMELVFHALVRGRAREPRRPVDGPPTIPSGI